MPPSPPEEVDAANGPSAPNAGRAMRDRDFESRRSQLHVHEVEHFSKAPLGDDLQCAP